MDNLRCPCGHPIGAHKRLPDFVGCLDFVGVTNGFGETEAEHCECDFSPFEALRAAQRKAAAEHLTALRRYRDVAALKEGEWFSGYCGAVSALDGAVAAYRAVGILGRKVKHDPA